MKIPWSGRAHNYNKKDIKSFLSQYSVYQQKKEYYLTDIIKYADPLTQGSYLKKFEKNFGSYIQKKKCFCS